MIRGILRPCSRHWILMSFLHTNEIFASKYNTRSAQWVVWHWVIRRRIATFGMSDLSKYLDKYIQESIYQVLQTSSKYRVGTNKTCPFYVYLSKQTKHFHYNTIYTYIVTLKLWKKLQSIEIIGILVATAWHFGPYLSNRVVNKTNVQRIKMVNFIALRLPTHTVKKFCKDTA